MNFTRPRIFFILFSFAFVALFSGCNFDEIVDDFTGPGESSISNEQLVIAYAEAPTSYSPLTYDSVNKKYLANIYEPLVRYDKSFNFKTGLAVSWGRIDDLTWEFRLRDGVFFHDGSEFDIQDVIYSFEMALSEDSGLSSLLEGIESFGSTEDGRLQILTKEPDPLLLHKLTNIYMISDGYQEFNSPLGTGPYLLVDYADNDIVLERFDDYWGNTPYFEEVILSYVPNPDDRIAGIEDGSIDFLVNVPPQYASDLPAYDSRVLEVPSLEVSFLMFSLDGPFAKKDLRDAVWYAIPNNYAETFGGGYLRIINQYAASGIFGSVTNVGPRSFDLDLAKEYRVTTPGNVSVVLDVPTGLEVLGAQVSSDLEKIDIDVSVNPMDPVELEKKILSGDSEFYFFGWRYDLADATDFFVSVVHSKNDSGYGEFNGISYENKSVDKLIEDIVVTLDESDRQILFAQLNEELDADQVVMPLFESKLLYGISNDLIWDTRLDGQVLASEIAGIVVE